MRHKALIIGGGISGLSAAYYLSKAGIRPTLIERNARIGGVIQTSVQQGCVLEEGPDGFLGAKPWAMNLIRDLGLADQVIGSNDHSRITYIVKNGKLVRMPAGLMMMVPTKFAPIAGNAAAGLGNQDPHGAGDFPKAEAARSPIVRCTIFCWIITARSRSIIWPSRCWPASMAATRAR